jgi:choline dehydrogenase-like flavoprotein
MFRSEASIDRPSAPMVPSTKTNDVSDRVLIDGALLPSNTVLDADVCIVGTGPAGLTITQELLKSRLKIVMLERGPLAGSASDDLASELEFESSDFPSPLPSLHNEFGGMAAIWNVVLGDEVTPAARYLPMDPIDFESRDWVPHSGWPVTFEEMSPYYDRARTVCGVGRFNFHGPRLDTGRAPLLTSSGALVTRLEQLGPATAFTRKSRHAVTKSENVRVVTNAVAVELVSANESHDEMARTVARSPGGIAFTVRSRVVVVAGGAIENARLLLNSTAESPSGLGNQFDNVGRFFMDHPRVSLGSGALSPEGLTRVMDLYSRHHIGGELLVGKLKLSENVLRQESLLNGNVLIVRNFSSAQQEGLSAASVVVNSMRRRQGLTRVPKHLVVATRHAIPVARHLALLYLTRPGAAGRSLLKRTTATERSFELNYQPEQAPNRDNRVTLGEQRDAFGYRVARLDWHWSEIDLQSIRRTREILASEFLTEGIGELAEMDGDDIRGEAGNESPLTAHHHLGTTRMHNDPGQGVVDRDCKLHDASSVYVAGGSVFPTGGYANPTLTIVALAIRLADELKRTLTAR